MSDKVQLTIVHLACLAVAAGCFWLSATVLEPYPQLGHLLVGGALWVWGKAGFAPVQAVVERLLEKLTPEQVGRVLARASSRPPPPFNDEQPQSPFPESPSARPPSEP